MTRDQAKALLNDLELIRHFAGGGDVGVVINGKYHFTSTICLSNFRSDRPSLYVCRIEKPNFILRDGNWVITAPSSLKDD